jgi:hypothetical protein
VLLQTTCSIGLAKRVATREPDDSKSGGNIDRIELVVRKDPDDLPDSGSAAHPLRGEGGAEPGFGAGYRRWPRALAVHRDRAYRARTRETPVLPSGHGDRSRQAQRTAPVKQQKFDDPVKPSRCVQALALFQVTQTGIALSNATGPAIFFPFRRTKARLAPTHARFARSSG